MNLDIPAYLALIIILSYFLVKSADLVESTFVSIAKKLGINTFLMGFVVLSAASSLPEISVAFNSAASGAAGLSIGNLVGASIVLITLVLGLNAVKSGHVPFTGSFGRVQVLLSLSLLGLMIACLIDQNLSVVEGIIMIAAYILFVAYVAYNGMTSKSVTKQNRKLKSQPLETILPKAFIGVIGLIFFSTLVVSASIKLAGLLGIGEVIIGILLLSIGTNLPEITVLIRSKSLDTRKLAVGNFLGSACLNVGTLGMLAVLAPFPVQNFSSLLPALVFFAIALILFGILAWSDHKLSRAEGLALISLYSLFVLFTTMQVITTAANPGVNNQQAVISATK